MSRSESGEVLKDGAARSRIRQSLDESLIVEAAAGTGKTTELVRRLVGVLAEGRAVPDSLVAVTFTRKAAGELKLRLREAIDAERSFLRESDQEENLAIAAARLEEAHIGTIHSFCGEMLRERPVEAEIDPAFEELAEDQAPRFFERAFRPWIENELQKMSPEIRRILSRTRNRGHWADAPLTQIRDAAWKFLEWRDFPASWHRKPFDREGSIDALIERTDLLARMRESCSRSRDPLAASLDPVVDLMLWIGRAERERGRDYDRLESVLVGLARQLARDRRKGKGKFSNDWSRHEVLVERDGLVAALEEFRISSEADLACVLQQELRKLQKLYAKVKSRAGRLDFVDLLSRARALLRDSSAARSYFQRRYSHIFVDEFQDTDPVQAEILLLLSSGNPDISDWRQVEPLPGKLFLVGDPKQSIYRFRRADVVLYEEIKEQLVERGVGLVPLTQNFRSVPGIQQAVNAGFESEMRLDRSRGQAAYVPLDPFREEATEQPSVIVLPVPHPYGFRNVSNISIEASLPGAAAAFIEWLTEESGWTIQDPEQNERQTSIRPGHVAVLFRRFVSWGRDITRDYTRELEARGIPHVLVGSRSFHEREEVETLRTALSAVEWPDDELSAYATLRGAFFSISDRILFWYRETVGSLNPFRRAEGDLPPELAPVREALDLLKDLHRKRNRRPFVRTVNELLDRTRAHAAFAMRPAGHQILANIQRICDIARRFEATGGTSFRALVEHLEGAACSQIAEAPVLEEGVDGVRLMTVHGAKGLEFPVVLLADPTCSLSSRYPDRFVDVDAGLAAFSLIGCRPRELLENAELEKQRDAAEGQRIAYVAATRARDLVVVPAVGDQERDGWLAPLNKALYPARDHWRDPAPAEGCPPLGDRTVLSRPHYYDGVEEFSVRPGMHRSLAGTHRVTWWDPALLKLDRTPNFGLRQEDILSPGETEGSRSMGLREYEDWKASRELILEKGASPSLDIRTVTSIVLDRDPPEPVVVQVAFLECSDTRPRGARFGSLVHALLRDVSFQAGRKEIENTASLSGRLLGAAAEEVEAAVEIARHVLSSKLIHRASGADDCRREMTVLHALNERELLEGTIDLAFREGDSWVILDYKTDLQTSEGARPEYVRQLQWYGHALRKSTGLEIEAWLLGV